MRSSFALLFLVTGSWATAIPPPGLSFRPIHERDTAEGSDQIVASDAKATCASYVTVTVIPPMITVPHYESSTEEGVCSRPYTTVSVPHSTITAGESAIWKWSASLNAPATGDDDCPPIEPSPPPVATPGRPQTTSNNAIVFPASELAADVSTSTAVSLECTITISLGPVTTNVVI
ncbi:hypothetical protein PG995_012925 [Apiospora arundinis]